MRVFRPFRNRGLSVAAMLLLVLGTAAPALARMTCVMGGPSTLSIGAAEDCMPVDHSHPVTTVKVPRSLRERISRDAAEAGQTAAEFLGTVVDRWERERRLSAVEHSYRARGDVDRSYQDETAAWQVTDADGFDG